VNYSASPTSTENKIPFTLTVPAADGGLSYRMLTLTIDVRGLNWNASAQKLSGDSFGVVPTKVVVVRKKR